MNFAKLKLSVEITFISRQKVTNFALEKRHPQGVSRVPNTKSLFYVSATFEVQNTLCHGNRSQSSLHGKHHH